MCIHAHAHVPTFLHSIDRVHEICMHVTKRSRCDCVCVCLCAGLGVSPCIVAIVQMFDVLNLSPEKCWADNWLKVIAGGWHGSNHTVSETKPDDSRSLASQLEERLKETMSELSAARSEFSSQEHRILQFSSGLDSGMILDDFCRFLKFWFGWSYIQYHTVMWTRTQPYPASSYLMSSPCWPDDLLTLEYLGWCPRNPRRPNCPKQNRRFSSTRRGKWSWSNS